jgi:hypothetical protein
MPASPKLARLVVKFRRGGHEIESEQAATGERALRIGLIMLARLDDLQAGDTLLCMADNVDGAPLPPPRVKHG